MTLDRKGKFTVLNFVSFLLALKVNLNIFIDNRDTCIFAVGLNQFIVRPRVGGLRLPFLNVYDDSKRIKGYKQVEVSFLN